MKGRYILLQYRHLDTQNPPVEVIRNINDEIITPSKLDRSYASYAQFNNDTVDTSNSCRKQFLDAIKIPANMTFYG